MHLPVLAAMLVAAAAPSLARAHDWYTGPPFPKRRRMLRWARLPSRPVSPKP